MKRTSEERDVSADVKTPPGTINQPETARPEHQGRAGLQAVPTEVQHGDAGCRVPPVRRPLFRA